MGDNRSKKAKIAGMVAAALALCLVSGLIGAFSTRHFGTSKYTISYADFISVMLSSISVLMTVLAIFLGVLGVIGWNSIEGRVRSRTEEFLNEGFKEGHPLHTMLRERTTEIMYEGVRPLEAANEADDTTFEDEDGPETGSNPGG
jgi:uncharacterized membrane protein